MRRKVLTKRFELRCFPVVSENGQMNGCITTGSGALTPESWAGAERKFIVEECENEM